MDNLILIGAGGHANSCIDVIEQEGRYQIIGMVGSLDEVGLMRFGYPVIGEDKDLEALANKYKFALITIGQIQSSFHRIRLFEHATKVGFLLPKIISPLAYVSSRATIGGGSIIMAGAIVNAGAKVGCNCIINSSALIEHDAIVGNHTHISTGAILNGDVRVGNESYIGSGSVVKEGVVIGDRCLVGMGLSVRHSLVDDSRFLVRG